MAELDAFWTQAHRYLDPYQVSRRAMNWSHYETRFTPAL